MSRKITKESVQKFLDGVPFKKWQDVGIKRRLEVQHYKRTFKRATGC